jgi:uncharacterized protein (TIGR01370 family)
VKTALLLLGLCVIGVGVFVWMQGQSLRWAVYYTDVLPSEAFQDRDVIVFDDLRHPDLKPLQGKGKILLGYISMAESGSKRPFPVHDVEGLKLVENVNWPGNFVLDIRRPEWKAFVLDVLIPSILAKGFDGVMMDTIESATDLENLDPVVYAGMRVAAVDLVRAVRERFPDRVIMVNRAFDILPEIAPSIDMLLAESIYVDYEWQNKKHVLFAEKVYKDRVKFLKDIQKNNPQMKIFSLDYWDPADIKGVKHIYRTQRAQGFHPYVSTMDLQKLTPEP